MLIVQVRKTGPAPIRILLTPPVVQVVLPHGSPLVTEAVLLQKQAKSATIYISYKYQSHY